MTNKINIPLLVLDFFIILPITIIRLVLIYIFGSTYGIDLIDQLLAGNSKGLTTLINNNLTKNENIKKQDEKPQDTKQNNINSEVSEDVESDDLLTDISTLINTPKLPDNNKVFNGVYPVRVNKKNKDIKMSRDNNIKNEHSKLKEKLLQKEKEKKEKERITKLMKMISEHKTEIEMSENKEIEIKEIPNKLKKSIFRAISNIDMDNDSDSESVEQKKHNDLDIIQSIIKKKDNPRRIINMETESNANIKINGIDQDSSEDESDSDSDIISENRIDLLNED